MRLIEKRLGFQIFMPDGRMDPSEAIKAAGLSAERQLLEPGEHYQAVITSIDDSKKTAGVLIGAIKAELPMDQMKWAHAVKDEKNPAIFRGEPKVPSQVVHKGEVILVKVKSNSEKGVVVSLEQEPQVQGALLSMDVATGNVLAMEGGYSFESSEFNRATQAQRQPGSAFKPFVYAAALEKGYTPASVIVDAPIVYEDADTGKWKPSNFEEKFYGDTTFRQALIKSRNVPTIKILQAIQVPFLLDYVKRIGMTAQLNADLSISLGSGAISLWELTKSYALFPRLGRKVEPIFISRVMDRDGKVLEETKPKPFNSVGKVAVDEAQAASPSPSATPVLSGQREAVKFPAYPLTNDPDQVLDPRVAFVMTHLMKEVVAYGTGHEAKQLGRPAAGKTGTTSEYNDAWFMGFTPHVVTGVWVGFDNHKSIGPSETGARAALPIWLGYMKEAIKGYPEADFTVPSQVVFASIDPASGKLARPNSSSAIKEAFIEGTEPLETSDSSTSKPDSQEDFFKEDTE
jgi:penicillin-binding protein 1A